MSMSHFIFTLRFSNLPSNSHPVSTFNTAPICPQLINAQNANTPNTRTICINMHFISWSVKIFPEKCTFFFFYKPFNVHRTQNTRKNQISSILSWEGGGGGLAFCLYLFWMTELSAGASGSILHSVCFVLVFLVNAFKCYRSVQMNMNIMRLMNTIPPHINTMLSRSLCSVAVRRIDMGILRVCMPFICIELFKKSNKFSFWYKLRAFYDIHLKFKGLLRLANKIVCIF